MTPISLIRQWLLIVLLIQFGNFAWAAKSKPKPNADNERTIMAKLKSATPELLLKGQKEGSMKLQSNLAKAMMTLSTKKSSATLMIPLEVREQIKQILMAIKDGEFNDPLFQGLPSILMMSKGNPAEQLQLVIKDVMPRAPSNMKGPLQGLFDFVKANQMGVNKYLGKLFNGTPSLLTGVVQSVAGTVGATNAAVGGSTDSLNQMVGGLLASLPVNGLLPG